MGLIHTYSLQSSSFAFAQADVHLHAHMYSLRDHCSIAIVPVHMHRNDGLIFANPFRIHCKAIHECLSDSELCSAKLHLVLFH